MPHNVTSLVFSKANGPLAVMYEVDGDASDWMLGKYGIIAASPELGTFDFNSY